MKPMWVVLLDVREGHWSDLGPEGQPLTRSMKIPPSLPDSSPHSHISLIFTCPRLDNGRSVSHLSYDPAWGEDA